MPTPSLGGADIKIPVYSSLANAANSWSDGKFSIGDVTAAPDIALSILNTALDPLGAILKSAVEYLMDLLLEVVKPLGEAVDFLLGNPDAIYEHAGKWQTIAESIADQGNQHAQTVTATPTWQSPAAEAYRQTQRTLNDSFQAATGAASAMGKWVSAVGSGVAIFRDLMWGMLVDFVTEIIKSAILALAAAIPSAGTSIGAFTGWLGVRSSMIAGKFAKKLSKLMKWCAKVARKLGFSGRAFDRAAESLSRLAQRFGQNAARRIARGDTTYYSRPGGGAEGPAAPNQLPVDPQLPGSSRPTWNEHNGGVQDVIDKYENAKKYGQEPVDNYYNEGTGREGTPSVQDI